MACFHLRLLTVSDLLRSGAGAAFIFHLFYGVRQIKWSPPVILMRVHYDFNPDSFKRLKIDILS